ncbi:MAG TPA: ATP-binding protein [Puia sp.]|nr:ATP-binding protein [Puia sp.]
MLLLVAVVGLLIITIRYHKIFSETNKAVEHTILVLDEDRHALSSLGALENSDADTAQLLQHILRLQQLTIDNPSQQARLDTLRQAASAPGRSRVDNIRALLLRVQAEEGRLLDILEAANGKSRDLLKNAIVTLLALALALLVASGFIIPYNLDRRKRAEKGLQESRDFAGLLVSNVKEYAICMIDPDGIVLTWNQGAEQINGYTREEIIGKPISVFYTNEQNARGEPVYNLGKAGVEGRYECIGLRKRKDGSEFYADVVLTAIRNEDGKLTGFMKITKDISAQIKVREDLNRALVRERELNEMKSRFVTMASHEFKTPLSVILSSTNLIERYNGPEMADNRLRHIHRIKSNLNNLKQLLNDFLSVEKLEEGIVRNDPARTDLVKMAEETIQDMEEACMDGQRIELEVRGEAQDVLMDQHLLRNILNNLLSNAIKYSPASSLIRFRVEFTYDWVRFSVADQGIGIPEKDQPHLFERFFRASNTGGVPGTGLGLSIVMRYLDLMGGTISVESQPATGSTFTITLPAV